MPPKYNPSVQTEPGDAGVGEFLRQPTRKRHAQRGYWRVLPTAMKAITADRTKVALLKQVNADVPQELEASLAAQTASDTIMHVYTGVFDGLGVRVGDREDMTWLYSQGFFGKGILSKSEPCYLRLARKIDQGKHQRITSTQRRLEKKKQRMKKTDKKKKSKNGKGRHNADQTMDTSADVSIISSDGTQQQQQQEHLQQSKEQQKADQHQQQNSEGGVSSVPDGSMAKHVSREVLQLSLVEAFFLQHALGCLKITNMQGEEMGVSATWTAFCTARPSFVQDYVAYLHLRSNGWVPKCGLKFAVDYVAYRQGPPFYHSSFSVLVKNAWEDTEEPWQVSTRPLTWQYINSLSRMSNQANKEVVLCYVLRPRDLSDEDMLSPSCITRFEVQQVLHRRWVLEKTRGSKDKDKGKDNA